MENYDDKIEKIEQKIEKLPEEISKKLSETMDLKIELSSQKLKTDFYKWLVPLLFSVVAELVGLVINFIMG